MRKRVLAGVLVASFAALAWADDAREKLREAAARGDLETAETLALALVEKYPKDPLAAFDLARVRSARGHPASALDALRLAAERGFAWKATLARAAVLDPVRSVPGFEDVRARIDANAAAELARFADGPAKKARLLHYDAPGKAARPTPLIVGLHPSGTSADFLAPLLRPLARERGAHLVLAQGLTPLGNGWDWGVAEHAFHLIERAIGQARSRAEIDPARIVAVGYSGGGNAGFDLALTRPELFAGVVLIGGSYEARTAPVPTAAPRLPRIALLIGERDERFASNREAEAALRAAGGAVLLRSYPGVGHELPPRVEAELRAALEFVLPQAPPTP
ncbi:MAG: dienelactone hydrolase family protein [Vicinamibacteria bacterium]|nr:dienelactone hydrolase family protein [Vicinamibacteria bacterium]